MNGSTVTYTSDETLYNGARSIVYRAHRDDDGHSVILKVLRAQPAPAGEVDRLRREYELMRGLDIPGVVDCYELVTDADSYTMVVEDFGGQSFDRLPAGRIELATFLDIAYAAAAALAALHERRIVHGNLSPSNIVYNAHSGQLKFIDFGSALDLSNGSFDGITRFAEVEPAYASPEQRHASSAEGPHHGIDERSDLFSLGVTLYELLTGGLPFDPDEAPELVGTGNASLGPSPAAPHEVRDDVPPSVSRIILRLLESNPDNRYQWAAELRTHLGGARVAELAALNSRLRQESALRMQVLAQLTEAHSQMREQQLGLHRQQQELIDAHAEIEVERQRYHDLFALAPDGYLVTDLQGIIREANHAAAALLGIDPQAVSGMPLVRFIEREPDQLKFSNFLKQVQESNSTIELECRLGPADRELVDVVMRCSAVRDRNGFATEARWLVRDITEQKRREEALRLSEERFRLLAESSQDVIYRAMYLPSPKIEYISSSVTALTGFTPEELYVDPDPMRTLVAPNDLPRAEELLRDLDPPWERTLIRWQRKGGGTVWFEHQLTPIYDDEGRTVGATGVARDVTARKQAEDALREREHLIERITTSSPDLIYILDLADGRAIYTNQRLVDLLGYAGNEAGAMGLDFILEHIHPDDKERAIAYLEGLAGSKDDEINAIEIRVRHASSEYRWFANRVVVFSRNSNGTTAQVMGTLTDITQQKASEAALQASEALFRTAVQDLQDAFGIYSAVRDDAGNIVDFKIEYVNPAAQIMAGYNPEDLIGHTILEFVRPGDETLLDKYRQVVETGEPLTIDSWSFERTYGDRRLSRVLDLRATRFGDGFVGIWRDVTEQKQYERLLLEREQFIENIARVTPGVIYLWDRIQQRIVYVNDQVELFTGLTPEEIIRYGASMPQAFPMNDMAPQQPLVDERIKRARDGEIVEFEHHIPHVDGSSRWLLTRAVIFTRDPNGAPRQVLCAGYDITARKMIEETVRQANAELNARVDELSALNRISQLLTTVTDLPSAFSTVCHYLIDLFKSSEANIAEVSESGLEVHVLSHISKDHVRPDLTGRTLSLLDYPVAKRAIELGEPIFIRTDGVQSTPRAVSGQVDEDSSVQEREWMQTRDFKSLIAQPLRSHGRVIGLLTIATNNDAVHWTQSDVLFAQTLAGTVASAMANARLFTQEQNQRLLAESLYEVGSVLASSLDVDAILHIILGQLKRVLDYDGAAIFLRDGDDLVESRGVGLMARYKGFRFLASSKGAQINVLKTGKPRFISDTQDYENWTPTGGATTVRSWMGAPLTIGDNRLGILTVSHQVPNTYTAMHLRVLQSFATQAAMAINNAQRYEEAQAIAAYEERNRLARDLHDSVTQSLFSANLVAEVLPELARNNPASFDKSLSTLANLTRNALAEMRTMLMELRPSSLTQAPLDSVIKNLVMSLGGTSKLDIVRPRLDPAPLLQDEVQVALYRLVQETLMNVVKHAQAGRAELELRVQPSFHKDDPQPWEGEIAIHIADDGKGFDVLAIPPGHLGLQIMSERAEAVGAALEITSEPGQGTQVTITWTGQAADQPIDRHPASPR